MWRAVPAWTFFWVPVRRRHSRNTWNTASTRGHPAGSYDSREPLRPTADDLHPTPTLTT